MTTDSSLSPVLSGLFEKLAEEQTCWYSSVRPDGRAHLAPIWFVWHANAAWMVTQRESVRARNLAHSNSVSLALPDAVNALILEGVAAESPESVELIRPSFQQKYDWDITSEPEYDFIIRVDPVKLMAWGTHGDGRWTFDPATALWSQSV